MYSSSSSSKARTSSSAPVCVFTGAASASIAATFELLSFTITRRKPQSCVTKYGSEALRLIMILGSQCQSSLHLPVQLSLRDQRVCSSMATAPSSRHEPDRRSWQAQPVVTGFVVEDDAERPLWYYRTNTAGSVHLQNACLWS